MRDGSVATGTAARFDAAVARMAGRLAHVVADLGDTGAAPFLADMAASAPDGPPPPDGSCLDLPSGAAEPVDRLVTGLAPAPLEVDLLALAALPHASEGAAAVLRSLHPERRPWATVGLAATLAEQGSLPTPAPHGRAAVRSALAGGTLVRAGALAVTGDGPEPERSVVLAPGLWEALTGRGGWPAGCRPDPRPAPSWGLDGWLELPEVVAAAAAVERGASVAVVAAGERPSGAATRLAALVTVAGRRPVLLHAPVVDERVAATVLLLALVRDVVPVVWTDQPPAGPVGGAEVPGPLVLAVPAAGVLAWPRPVVLVPVGPLGRADRLAAAAAALPELGDLAHPVGPATLEPSDLAVAAADVRATARLAARPVRVEDVTAVVDRRTTSVVPAGAVLVHPAAAWDDLVLPPDRLEQLREAVDRMRGHGVVLSRWGFLRGRPGRQGLRLLFCGPPGTGKTLAAEVVAGELGRDLLIVDLSRMVSKWIGETEKNLAAAFDAAERGGAALFFDEADALFGRRTEVGDARDRYANLETAYLLSRLERFEGVAVLATNLRQNLDAAFARRIEFIVPFDRPDAAAREELWRRHLPPGAPVAPSVDVARLATLYDLPGALIRNAAVAAAFLAAADGSPAITVRHVVHAVRREYVKAGQAFPGVPAGIRP